MAKYEEVTNNLNMVGNGTSIVGNITSVGDIRVDGILDGNLSTKSKLVVGTTGQITGEVNCKDCEISGNVKGKVVVENLLVLRSTATIIGDVKTLKLSIEPNAVFSGTCDMSSSDNSVDVS